MYFEKEKFMQLQHFLTRVDRNFHLHCQEIREIVDRTELHGFRYGTFYINKDTKARYKNSSGLSSEEISRLRKINYPEKNLKTACKEINDIMGEWCANIDWIHGFSKNAGVATNAIAHAKINPKHMINIDLKNAFNQITYQNIKDFAEHCLLFNSKQARKLAEMLTKNGRMVQGNPLSPTILNLMCIILDLRLNGIAKRLGLVYTRYADDLTISSPSFLKHSFIKFLLNIIKEENFLVNNKTKVMKTQMEVTGINLIHKDFGSAKLIPKRRKLRSKIRALEHRKTKGQTTIKSDNNEDIQIDMVISGINAWFYPHFRKIDEKHKESFQRYKSLRTKGWRKKFKKNFQPESLTRAFKTEEITPLSVLRQKSLEEISPKNEGKNGLVEQITFNN